eukprot:gene3692-4886_t
MYIGQMDPSEDDMWIYNASKKCMEKRKLYVSAGLVKIFDEALVNAADNIHKDPSMSRIDVTIEVTKKDELVLSVRNDGKGIPVVKHPLEDDIYIPNLVFGHLLTGSNFDDNQ